MQKKNSSLGAHKFLVFILLASTAIISARCSTTEEDAAQKIDELPGNYKPSEATAITKNGFNEKPQLSPDGKWLLFIRSKAAEHQQAQLYMREVATGIEKRLTFQDGDVLDAQFDPSAEWIYFSSTTDEMKENSSFIRDTLAKRNGTAAAVNVSQSFGGEPLLDSEIYRIKRNGMSIDRMTQSEKFDGQVAFRPMNSEVFFTSLRTGNTQIYRMNVNSERADKFTAGQNVEQYPGFSSDGKTMVFVRKTPTNYELISGNVNARNWTKVFESTEPITDAGILPGTTDIFFVTKIQPSQWRDLYTIQKDGKCLKRFTYDSADEKHPTWSVKGDVIFFARSNNGASQLNQMKFQPPTCPEPPAPVDSKQAVAVPAKTE